MNNAVLFSIAIIFFDVYGLKAQLIPVPECNTCISGHKILLWGSKIYKNSFSSTGECEYKVEGYTRGEISQVSVVVNGTLGFAQETITTSDVDVSIVGVVEDNVNVWVEGGHSAGASLGSGCKSCQSIRSSCGFSGGVNGGSGPGNTPGPPHSPILIDLDRDGFHFGGRDSPVLFDIMGSGQRLLMHWVEAGSGDAFLARDINGNGVVDDGSELFGVGTRLLLERQRNAPNGYVALAQFDDPKLGGNNDGFITTADAIWAELILWNDVNADGYSEGSEIQMLGLSGIRSLGIIPYESRQLDEHGNWLRFWSHAARSGHGYLDMVDVFFLGIQNDAEAL